MSSKSFAKKALKKNKTEKKLEKRKRKRGDSSLEPGRSPTRSAQSLPFLPRLSSPFPPHLGPTGSPARAPSPLPSLCVRQPGPARQRVFSVSFLLRASPSGTRWKPPRQSRLPRNISLRRGFKPYKGLQLCPALRFPTEPRKLSPSRLG